MYAIVQTGGKQYRAEKDVEIVVDLLEAEEGSALDLDEVLMISDEGDVKIGAPFVAGAKVKAQVVRHEKAKKINAFNYKAKKNPRKRWGHRQQHTRIRVLEVIGGK